MSWPTRVARDAAPLAVVLVLASGAIALASFICGACVVRGPLLHCLLTVLG